jgi:hypothetical protein
MATKRNLRYCEVLFEGAYYEVLVGVNDLDEINDILQEWALANTDIGEALDLPSALTKNQDITEVLTSKNIDEYVYVKSAISAYMDFPRSAGISGIFPTLAKVLVASLYVMPACTAYLWSLPAYTGVFGEYVVPTLSFSLVANEVNYIGIKYNAGIPAYALYTSAASFDYSSIIPVCAVLYFDGELNVIPFGQAGSGLPEKLLEIQKKRKEFDIIADFIFNDSTLYVELGALSVSNGAETIVCPAMDTETVGDDMWLWYRDGVGDWQKSKNNTINNTQYQTLAAGLGTLSGGEFVINYLFRAIDDANKLMFNVLSNKFATAALAKESDMITDLPDAIKEGCVLVGRMIVEQASSSPTTQKIQRVSSFGTVA